MPATPPAQHLQNLRHDRDADLRRRVRADIQPDRSKHALQPLCIPRIARGELPLIETWINGTPIAKLDTAKLANRMPGYDSDVILKRIDRKGHIGFEVHDNGKMGRNRWAPGAVCRWRDIQITEF